MEFRRLLPSDARGLWDLRLRALEIEPEAFGESTEEHRAVTIEDYARRLAEGGADSFVFGASNNSGLVGMAGFYRDRRVKRSHKGWIWGVFVIPEARSRGIARVLLLRLIEDARALAGMNSILLSVAVTQDAARRLYRSLGFRPFGLEPRSLRVGDRYVDEEYMILDVAPAESG